MSINICTNYQAQSKHLSSKYYYPNNVTCQISFVNFPNYFLTFRYSPKCYMSEKFIAWADPDPGLDTKISVKFFCLLTNYKLSQVYYIAFFTCFFYSQISFFFFFCCYYYYLGLTKECRGVKALWQLWQHFVVWQRRNSNVSD